MGGNKPDEVSFEGAEVNEEIRAKASGSQVPRFLFVYQSGFPIKGAGWAGHRVELVIRGGKDGIVGENFRCFG